MNLSIIKKILFLYTVIFSFVCFGENLTSIKSIANFAEYKMIICNRLKCASVFPRSTKNLNSSFSIPFVSIKQNLKEFVKDIPFAPKRALKVSTQTGVFFIWRNESGVVCAPDPSNPEAVVAWKLKILLDKKNNKNVNLSNLALKIDKDGNFEMKQQRDLPKGTTTCLKDSKQI